MSEFRTQLRGLIADRQSAEARALYGVLLKYVDGRVRSLWRHACADLLSESEVEEVVADVMFQLVSAGLAQFRGNSLPELIGFCRTVADRNLWHRARRARRERDLLDGAQAETVRDWQVNTAMPDQAAQVVPESPLAPADQDYLFALLRAGSKAEHARRAEVTRAAVTRRVQAIRARIDALAPRDKAAAEVWLEQAARQVLDEQGLPSK